MITAFGSHATHVAAKAMGAVAVFDKPFQLADLRREVARHLPLAPPVDAVRRKAPGAFCDARSGSGLPSPTRCVLVSSVLPCAAGRRRSWGAGGTGDVAVTRGDAAAERAI